MLSKEVQIGRTYIAKVSDKRTKVRIDGRRQLGGWNATNLATNKKVTIKTARRLTDPNARLKPAPAKPKVISNDGKAPGICATVGCNNPATKTNGGRARCDSCYADEHESPVEREAAKAQVAAADAEATKKTSAGGERKRSGTSVLDAAAVVLRKAGESMNCKSMIAAMGEQGLWSSPNGKTPHATLYAAILREISAKGDAARFEKADRGLFRVRKGA